MAPCNVADVQIVQEGCLPLLVAMLKYNDVEEQMAAAKTVWMLSFGKDLVNTIKVEADMMDTLEALAHSDHVRVKKFACGALWVLKEEAEHRERMKSPG